MLCGMRRAKLRNDCAWFASGRCRRRVGAVRRPSTMLASPASTARRIHDARSSVGGGARIALDSCAERGKRAPCEGTRGIPEGVRGGGSRPEASSRTSTERTGRRLHDSVVLRGRVALRWLSPPSTIVQGARISASRVAPIFTPDIGGTRDQGSRVAQLQAMSDACRRAARRPRSVSHRRQAPSASAQRGRRETPRDAGTAARLGLLRADAARRTRRARRGSAAGSGSSLGRGTCSQQLHSSQRHHGDGAHARPPECTARVVGTDPPRTSRAQDRRDADARATGTGRRRASANGCWPSGSSARNLTCTRTPDISAKGRALTCRGSRPASGFTDRCRDQSRQLGGPLVTEWGGDRLKRDRQPERLPRGTLRRPDNLGAAVMSQIRKGGSVGRAASA